MPALLIFPPALEKFQRCTPGPRYIYECPLLDLTTLPFFVGGAEHGRWKTINIHVSTVRQNTSSVALILDYLQFR